MYTTKRSAGGEPQPIETRCLERKLGEAMVKHDIMAHVPYVSTLQSSVAM